MPESDASGVIVGDGMASWSYTVVRRSIDKDGKYQEITRLHFDPSSHSTQTS